LTANAGKISKVQLLAANLLAEYFVIIKIEKSMGWENLEIGSLALKDTTVMELELLPFRELLRLYNERDYAPLLERALYLIRDYVKSQPYHKLSWKQFKLPK